MSLTIPLVEIAVLQTVLSKGLATLADVAVGTKLSTSKAKQIIEELNRKHLVKEVDSGVIRVTDEGVVAAQNVNRHAFTMETFEPTDSREVESELEEVLSKLRG